jgi:hypothetical protein
VTEEDSTWLTAGLLPWLSLDERVSFGGYWFEHLSRIASRLEDDVSATLSAVASTFVEPFGTIDPVAIWATSEGDLPSFSEPDVDRAHNATRLLSVVALISNEYFTWSQPATASNFALVFQRFQPGRDSFALVSRRRDGETLSGGHTFGDTRFTRPLAAPSSPSIKLPPALLSAIGTAAEADDPLSVRIRQSGVPFTLANRLDEFATVEGELFWVATAIEQLLAVWDRPRGQRITSAFVERLTEQVLLDPPSWPHRTMVKTWARELYGRRSDVHGARHAREQWHPAWHVLLATVAYGLALRTLLADENRYELTESDEDEMGAFPRRVARFRDRRLVNGAASWKLSRDAAESRRLRHRILEYLRQQES